MSQAQLSLFDELPTVAKFPTTRYQGSKLKFVDWIWDCIKDISFQTALDAFGGTGCVAYRLKQEGKAVTYNDLLPFNYLIGKALIENRDVVLDDWEMEMLLKRQDGITYPHFIEDTFKDIYFAFHRRYVQGHIFHGRGEPLAGYRFLQYPAHCQSLQAGDCLFRPVPVVHYQTPVQLVPSQEPLRPFAGCGTQFRQQENMGHTI